MPIIYVFWSDPQEKKFEINKQTYESDKYEFVDMLRLETKKCLRKYPKINRFVKRNRIKRKSI